MGMKTHFSVRGKPGIKRVKNAAQSAEEGSGIRGLPQLRNQWGFVSRKHFFSEPSVWRRWRRGMVKKGRKTVFTAIDAISGEFTAEIVQRGQSDYVQLDIRWIRYRGLKSQLASGGGAVGWAVPQQDLYSIFVLHMC